MSGFVVTLRKELLSYFVSPVSWIIAVVFYLWRGFELAALVERCRVTQGDPDTFPSLTYSLPSTFLMVMLVPGILTMRCFAEERRTGSMELLTSAPVRDGAVVLGKWAAATVFYALLWLPSALVLHALEYGPLLATDLAFGPVVGAYLGMILLSALLLAFGCFASSLTDNVLLAALLGILFSIGLLYVAPALRPELAGLQDGHPVLAGYLRELLDRLDVGNNFRDWFARGLIDTSQLAFYAGGVAFFLFLTTVSVSSRRVA
jgi:ABC-2 type transport system permease protein